MSTSAASSDTTEDLSNTLRSNLPLPPYQPPPESSFLLARQELARRMMHPKELRFTVSRALPLRAPRLTSTFTLEKPVSYWTNSTAGCQSISSLDFSTSIPLRGTKRANPAGFFFPRPGSLPTLTPPHGTRPYLLPCGRLFNAESLNGESTTLLMEMETDEDTPPTVTGTTSNEES